MFSGSLVAIVTPLRPDGSLDLPAWARLIDFHLANGTSGIVVGGTTGESATLTDAELRELVETACAQARGRIPIIAGAGTSSTAATVARVRWLSELPLQGLLVVTPAYNKPTQEGLYQHFAAVARATRLPVVLYNVPGRTAVDMQPVTVARLAQLPGVVAVKEAVAETERVRELLALCPRDFAVLSGDDPTARQSILAGARGCISVTANVVPRAMADMIAAASRGDAVAAERLDQPLGGLHRDLFLEANPIPVKWALARMGQMGGAIRLPLTELSAVHQPALLASLRQAGVGV
ncbi:MAG TPA: 4-hydroxy-tetrahydrodipicolinate synthase [Steroidobacteraceae bacterium]|nr:4-hydroxy-tetrahydrodipicolinate synthase [Steroidobacteraceae bacterium]